MTNIELEQKAFFVFKSIRDSANIANRIATVTQQYEAIQEDTPQKRMLERELQRLTANKTRMEGELKTAIAELNAHFNPPEESEPEEQAE